jgi:translocation and assembly module TamB
MALAVKGTLADKALDFTTKLNGQAGAALQAAGKVGLEGFKPTTIEANATLDNLPAALVSSFVPNLDAGGMISGTAKVSGALPLPSVDFKVNWANATTRQTKSANLPALGLDATGRFADNKIDFDANLASNSKTLLKAKGNAALNGANVQGLSVNADITDLPASLANGFVPGLGAEGTISGTAKTSGPPANPVIDFNVDWKNAATSQTRASGVGALSANAAGKLADNKVDFTATLSGGAALKATGSYVIAGANAQTLGVKADIANLPAGLANAFVPGLAAEGAITGTVGASGKLPMPDADFKLDWRNAATSQTKGAGISLLSIGANGKLAGGRLTIDTNVTGDAGLSLKGGGNLAITGNRALDLRFTGNLPFAVLGTQLAAQGLTADGTANFNLQVGGTAAAPVINGTVTTNGAKIVDVRRNLAINSLTADIRFNGQQAVISPAVAVFR